MTQGRLPIGFILCRLEDPKAQQHVLDLTLTAQEGPRWARVIQRDPSAGPGIGTHHEIPIAANPGDRVLVKQYCAHDVELVLPDTPEEMVCAFCNALQADPDVPPACLRRPDVVQGHLPHEFALRATPEPLLIVNLADILYVEAGPA